MASKEKYQVLSGICPDQKCLARLFFPAYDSSIECSLCGQRHERSALREVQEVSNPEIALQSIFKNVLISNVVPKKGADMVKVLGLSNYHCKLLSPILTTYGMDKDTGKAKLLQDMKQGEYFDCSVLGDRAFLIDSEHISIVGYGRDISGNVHYLSDTLELVKDYNDNEERLVPIHADGDGHCLVHAVSRALVGRELFWHPLRCNLKRHFETNLQEYKELLKEFVDEREWDAIIAECDPDFVPPDGELLGLRNIHILGLANVLKRPIILLDSLAGMQSLGDYSGLFLPCLVSPEECKGRNRSSHKPLCIAWSSSGRNHYIPLVGIKGRKLPKLPRHLIPKAWGIPQYVTDTYIEFDDNGCCTIGGNRNLGDKYILRLAASVEEVFIEKFNVQPSLVADVHHYVYQKTGIVGAKPQDVLQSTQKAISENRLYRCLTCDAVCEQQLSHDWLMEGGYLYKLALSTHGCLLPSRHYSFQQHGLVCRFDPIKNELIPEDRSFNKCIWCHGQLIRRLNRDGSICYKNGDRTKTLRSLTKHVNCNCGYKHYWNGKEYDNLPRQLRILLEWDGKVIHDHVTWFQHESDRSLNSNVYEVSSEVVQKHFPGVFGIEHLTQRVVEQILEQTKEQLDDAEQKEGLQPTTLVPEKIIICGSKVLHKEELGLSNTEHRIRQNVEQLSSIQQKRRSSENFDQDVDERSPQTSPAKSVPRRDEPTPPPALFSSSSSSTSVNCSSNSIRQSARYVRVVTSDGRQAQLHLDSNGITFAKLQDWIRTEFLIPLTQQRIKYGFPPQELHPPSEEEENQISLSHGDRIMVEILPDIVENTNHSPPSATSSDPLDAALLSLHVTANISGTSVWEFAQKYPHLFESGGLFYRQAQRDLGLEEGKHCQLPLMTNKVFRYSASSDRLELCLEPYGHFAVREGIDEIIKKVNESQQTLNSLSSALATSNVIPVSVHSKRMSADNVAFQGKGHLLRSSTKTSTETSVLENHNHHKSNSNIQREDNPAETVLIRMGPGYSKLLPVSSKMVKHLASTNIPYHSPESTSSGNSLQLKQEKSEDSDVSMVETKNEIVVEKNANQEVSEPMEIIHNSTLRPL